MTTTASQVSTVHFVDGESVLEEPLTLATIDQLIAQSTNAALREASHTELIGTTAALRLALVQLRARVPDPGPVSAAAMSMVRSLRGAITGHRVTVQERTRFLEFANAPSPDREAHTIKAQRSAEARLIRAIRDVARPELDEIIRVELEVTSGKTS